MSSSWNCNRRKKPDPPEMLDGTFLDTSRATSPRRKKPDPPELVVCSALEPKNPNECLLSDGDEAEMVNSDERKEPILHGLADAISPSRLELPVTALDPNNPKECLFPDELEAEMVNSGEKKNIIGMTFLSKRDVDGVTYRHRAEVKKRLETVDGETDLYLVSLGDGKREEVMTYSALLDIREKQHAEQVADPDGYCTFKSIADHRKNGSSWDVLVKWEDESETWEPLSSIWRQDPVTLAAYAKDHGLLETHGWKRFKPYVKTNPELVSGTERTLSPEQGITVALSMRFPFDFSDRPVVQRFIDATSSHSPTPIEPVVRKSQTTALTFSPEVCNSMQQGGANSICGNGRDRVTVPWDIPTLPESEEYQHDSMLGNDEFGMCVPPHYPGHYPALHDHPSQLPIYASQHPQPAGDVGNAKSSKNGSKRPSTGPSEKTLGAPSKKAKKSPAKSSKKKSKMVTSFSSEPINRQKSAAAIAAVNATSGGKKVRATTRGITMRPSGKWQAQLYYAGNVQYIGVFDTKAKAALAFKIAREKLNSDKLLSGGSAWGPRATEAAINSARLAAYEGVNEENPRVPSK